MPNLPYIAAPYPNRSPTSRFALAAVALAGLAGIATSMVGFTQEHRGLAWTGAVIAVVVTAFLAFVLLLPRPKGVLVIDSKGVRWPELHGFNVPWNEVASVQRLGAMLIFQLRSGRHAMKGSEKLGREIGLDPPHLAALVTSAFPGPETIIALCEDMTRQAGGSVNKDFVVHDRKRLVGRGSWLIWP